MQKIYTIIKEGITIGFFPIRNERDEAFYKFVLPSSNNCIKSEV